MDSLFDFEYSNAEELVEKGVEALMKYRASENIDDYSVNPEGLEVFENLLKFFKNHTEMNTFSVKTELDPIGGCAYITANIEDFDIWADDIKTFGLLLSKTSAFEIYNREGVSVIEMTVPGVFRKTINP